MPLYDSMFLISKGEYISLKRIREDHAHLVDSIGGDVNGGQVNHIEHQVIHLVARLTTILLRFHLLRHPCIRAYKMNKIKVLQDLNPSHKTVLMIQDYHNCNRRWFCSSKPRTRDIRWFYTSKYQPKQMTYRQWWLNRKQEMDPPKPI